MAKKKLTHHPNDHKQDAPQPHHPAHMDDPSEKLQSLKDLNSRLLKETTERRQQVESLVQAKEALESAFKRSAMENNALEFRLYKATEDSVGLDLENGVLLVFVQTQMREMCFWFDRLVGEKNDIECAKTERETEIAFLKGELNKLSVCLENERDQLSRLSRERDEMKNGFDGLVAEANWLREKVIEAEKKENARGNEVQKPRKEGEKLMEEKDEKERAISELMTERDLAQRKSAESSRVIEMLKEDIEGIMRDKNETEEQKNAQELKVIGLELELKKLNETLKNTRKAEALLRTSILEYETSLAKAMEKEKDMEMDIRALLKEKKENEQSIEMLTERRDSIRKVLDMVQKELEDKQHKIDEAIRVKNEIEQVKLGRETEIVELHRELDQLRDVMHKLKESCRDLEEKNKQLLSEVDHYRNAAEEVMLERDDIRKGFDEEKNKVKNLVLQVAGMEDKIKKTAAELCQMRSEREKLIENNEMMESRVGILMNEKDVLQRCLLEAQRDSHDLRAKIEFSCINSNQALALLKNTAALVCHSKNDKDSVEEVVSIKKLEEEIQPYAEELDAIRNVFRNKNKMVEDMKQQLASLQNSAAEAHKKKNLWTVISPVTTILVAALAAYVARGR